MKIVMVCPDWFPFSAGLAQSCYETCDNLIQNGHQVRVIVAKDKNLDSHGLDVYPIRYLFRLLGKNPISVFLFHKIRDHIKWADIICIFSYIYEMNGRIAFFKKIHLFKKPLVHFYRGSLEPIPVKKISFLTKISKKLYDATYGKMVFNIPDLVISNSEPTISLIKEKFSPKNKIVYINNALRFTDYPSWKSENKRVLFIGRLVENKGISFFPEIIKNIPKDWIFTVVGNGPMKNVIENIKAKFSNIEIIEKLPHSSLLNLISNSDILILPTFAEGAPRAVMEASAIGIPSIAFNVGDMPNMIPEMCGYCIEPFNIDDFCRKLKELIENPELRRKMGENARNHAEKTFDWKKVYPKIEKELINLLETTNLSL